MATPVAAQSAKYMAVDEIETGMRGYGLNVFRGTDIARFDFEVIDVVRNYWGPRQSVILVRCSGQGLDKSGIVSGMSGAPLYIDDRMIGAVAFKWPFAKEPLAGVTPIGQMLKIPTDPPADDDHGAGVSLPAKTLLNAMVHRTNPIPIAMLRRMRPPRGMSLPLSVSSAAPGVIPLLEEYLKPLGLQPVGVGVGGAAAPQDIKLTPGATLAVSLLQGDLNIAAVGTVTEVDDSRVLGFGHAFLAQGAVDLPMATGHVYTIVPSVHSSFKVAAPIQTVGRLVSDETSGISGRTGPSPKMIPLTVHFEDQTTGRVEDYDYRIARHFMLTPIITAAAVGNSMLANHNLPAENSVRLVGSLFFEDGIRLEIDELLSGPGASVSTAIMGPIVSMMMNPYRQIELTSGQVNIQLEGRTRVAQVLSATLDRDRIRAGERITVTAQLQPYRIKGDPPSPLQVSIRIPDHLPDGSYQLSLADARQYLALMQSEMPHRFEPSTLAGYLRTLETVLATRLDSLYLVLHSNQSGVAVDSVEMDHLPRSRAMVYTDPRRTNAKKYKLFEFASAQSDYVLSGLSQFSLTVDANAP